MRKIFNFGLMAALVCGIGMFVASCDDDKDGGKTEEQKKQEAIAAQASKAFKFYDVVSQLADLSDMDDATYETQTFEPIIGEASENEPLTRIVATNDMETAAARFADIIGLSVGSAFSASTSSYTYNDPDVGTLKWSKTTDGTSWATVDVNIKQVPHLERIVYCTSEQMGENASKKWTAYYRFGDVIKRRYVSKNMTTVTEYWICVRPAFCLEDKGDSHWISVGQLPEDYMQRYPTTAGEMWDGNKEWYVPTKLCTDTENMQNFAEMLYAIFNPTEWEENVKKYSKDGLKMFWDFKPANIDYHNKYFWERVEQGWRDNNIAKEAFNINHEELADFVAAPNMSLNLLYKGYSWYYNLPEWMGGWNCELNTACFYNGDKNSEKNFHHVDYDKVTRSMKDIKFDCHKMGKTRDNYRQFFVDDEGNEDPNYRWVVRYAKGKQLMASGTFNKCENIVGCEDVWRYNEKYGPWNSLSNTEPEITPEGFADRGYYTIGDVVKDERGNRWICCQASPNNTTDYPGTNYAYFVSFDSGALGANMENLPSKNLAMQMLYGMEVFCHDIWSGVGIASVCLDNMKNYGNFDVNDVVAARDSLHAYPNAPDKFGQITNSFISALYRDTDEEICVMRLIGDYTASMPNGVRWWSWRFYDSYTQNLATAPKRMLLSDLGNANIVNAYNRDRWVTLPWHEVATNSRTQSPGYRTQTEDVTDLSRFLYVRGRSYRNGSMPTNMYREPIVAFAVKRVVDAGAVGKNLTFDDGTKFTHVCLGHKVNPDYLGKDMVTSTYVHKYFTTTLHFLNDNGYQWGMANPTY